MDAELQQQINQYNDQIAHGGPAHVYAKLADVYRKAGRMQEAAHTARTGLEKFPESLLIQESLGMCLLDTGESTSAVRALAPVVEKLPENGQATIALAIALSRINRSQEAVKVLQRRLGKDPLDQKARLLLQQLDGGKPETPVVRPVPEKVAPKKEEILPLPLPDGSDQTDVAFVVRSAGALFDAVPMMETDVVVDMKHIFDDKPRPRPVEPDKTPITESAQIREKPAPKPPTPPAPEKVDAKHVATSAPSAPPVATTTPKSVPAIEKPAEKKAAAIEPSAKPIEKPAPTPPATAPQAPPEEKAEAVPEEKRGPGLLRRFWQWLTGSRDAQTALETQEKSDNTDKPEAVAADQKKK